MRVEKKKVLTQHTHTNTPRPRTQAIIEKSTLLNFHYFIFRLTYCDSRIAVAESGAFCSIFFVIGIFDGHLSFTFNLAV